MSTFVNETTTVRVRVYHNRKVAYEQVVDRYAPGGIEALRQARKDASEFAERLRTNPAPFGDDPPYGTCSICGQTCGAAKMSLTENHLFPLACETCVPRPK